MWLNDWYLIGGKLFIRHDQNVVSCQQADTQLCARNAQTINYLRLQHWHSNTSRSRQNIPCWSFGKLLISRVWNGKYIKNAMRKMKGDAKRFFGSHSWILFWIIFESSFGSSFGFLFNSFLALLNPLIDPLLDPFLNFFTYLLWHPY